MRACDLSNVWPGNNAGALNKEIALNLDPVRRANLGRPRIKTADPELIRAINRFHVLNTIRRYGPISRVEIAERTELSRATVSAITGALIEDALDRPTTVAAGAGRG